MDIIGWAVENWFVFIVITAFILFGFIGYMVDRKKYEQYRQEIINEEYAASTLQSVPGINEVADVIPANDGYYDPNAGYDQGYYDDGTAAATDQAYDPGYTDQGTMM